MRDGVSNPVVAQVPKEIDQTDRLVSSSPSSSSSSSLVIPEKETYDIELTKDENGLGITVAGYVCEKGYT